MWLGYDPPLDFAAYGHEKGLELARKMDEMGVAESLGTTPPVPTPLGERRCKGMAKRLGRAA